MKLRTDISLKQITLDDLMKCHKLEEVSGYCANCSNFGRNHSCPEFGFDIAEYLSKYKYATIIMTHIETAKIKVYQDRLMKNEYESRVFNNYKKHNPDVKTDWKSKVSMFVFDYVKNEMGDRLIELEGENGSIVSLPPGSCTRCSRCTKTIDGDCVMPHSLRYSLEALGFLVSDIYRDHFDLELGWTKDELPESFNTCSALLSTDPIDTGKLTEELGMIEVTL